MLKKIFVYIVCLLCCGFANIFAENVQEEAAKEMALREMPAIESLGLIRNAELMYKAANDNFATLTELGTPSGEFRRGDCIDPALARGQKDEYVFNVVMQNNTFFVTAVPLDKSTAHSFYVTEKGDLYQSEKTNIGSPSVFDANNSSADFFIKYSGSK